MKKIIKISLVSMLVFGLLSSTALGFSSAIKSENKYEVSIDEFFTPTPEYSYEEIREMQALDPDAVSYNEFDRILEQKNEAKKIIQSKNATKVELAEANEILEFDPAKQVYEYQTKSDTELQNLGLDSRRIAIIRAFRGTSAELKALGSTCTISGTPSYAKNVTGYWAKTVMSFSWSGAPFWTFKDAMLGSASASFLVERVDDTKCTVQYRTTSYPHGTSYSLNSGKNSMMINPFSGHLVQGFSYDAVRRTVNADGQVVNHYAMSGTATFVYRSNSQNRVGMSYGHAHGKLGMNVSAGIEFSSSGASVSFGLNPSKYEHIIAKAFSTYSY